MIIRVNKNQALACPKPFCVFRAPNDRFGIKAESENSLMTVDSHDAKKGMPQLRQSVAADLQSDANYYKDFQSVIQETFCFFRAFCEK